MTTIDVTLPCGIDPARLRLARLAQQLSDASAAAERLDTDEADRVVLFVADQYGAALGSSA